MAYDLIVIGGGPAGYVAAIRAAQHGKKVACVEADRAGGTCLNWGCIPTKALLKNAELYQTLTHKATEMGLKIEGLSYDWSAVVGRSRKVSDKLAGGIEFLFKKNKVDYIRGYGSIEAEHHHRHGLCFPPVATATFQRQIRHRLQRSHEPRRATEGNDYHRRGRHWR